MNLFSKLVVGAVTALAVGDVHVQGTKPNILLVLVDDWGWNDVGYHRERLADGTEREIQTPNINKLVKEGIELDRHYTYNFCSPTRSSLQSGRLPVHVVVENADPISVNPEDPISGFSGIPTKMTGIAQKLKSAGYRTHMTGKWDCGMATHDHTPMGRGYETFYGFFHHANDYQTQTLSGGSTVHTDACFKRGLNLVDLWNTNGPARHDNGTLYEEELFTRNSLKVIKEHDPKDPLFLFHSFHIVHTPLQVPSENENQFKFLRNQHRRRYAAMVNYMDDALGKIVDAFKEKGMWDNTLLVVSSDNGGPIYGSPLSPTGGRAVFGAANNQPHRGGKTSDWEGGVRVNAFVSGGFVPEKMRGSTVKDYIHVADWYATFSHLAGVDPTDTVAAEYNLPPIDSINQWDVLSGNTASGQGPRKEIHVSKMTLIHDRYKLLTGSDQAILPFPKWPSSFMTFDTYHPGWGWKAVYETAAPGRDCKNGCLFDIVSDPNEEFEITHEHPDLVAQMMARLKELNKGNFNPDRGTPQVAACHIAMEKYGGFYGPFVGVEHGVDLDTIAEFEFTEEEAMSLAYGAFIRS